MAEAELAEGPGAARCAGSSPVVPICFVGDLHGRLDVLQKIIKESDRRGEYHYVLMGDLLHHKRYFKRSKPAPSIQMLSCVRHLEQSGRATVIMGNNEGYILESINRPVKDIKSHSVRQTVSQLNSLRGAERKSMLTWMRNMRKYMEIQRDGVIYRVAHAYYPNQRFSTDSYILSGPGYPWFKKDSLLEHLDPSYQYILGHYGYPYLRDNLKIIDSTLFEGVGTFYTDRNEFMVYY
jgi:hypothetical protein